MNMSCDFCGTLLKDGDTVRAIIITKFVGLKSKRVWALEKPQDCLGLSHHPDCPHSLIKDLN